MFGSMKTELHDEFHPNLFLQVLTDMFSGGGGGGGGQQAKLSVMCKNNM